MKKNNKNSKIDGLVVLLLFGVFAVCILAVLLTGAKAYRSLNNMNESAFNYRSAVQYMSTRLRQADGMDVGCFEEAGVDGIEISEEIDGEMYVTRVYYYDGYIREQFSFAEMEFWPKFGAEVVKAGDMKVSGSPGEFTVDIVTEDGEQTRLILSMRSEVYGNEE